MISCRLATFFVQWPQKLPCRIRIQPDPAGSVIQSYETADPGPLEIFTDPGGVFNSFVRIILYLHGTCSEIEMFDRGSGGGGMGRGALSKKERNIRVCHCFWCDGLPRNGNVGQCNARCLSHPYARAHCLHIGRQSQEH
jgi:hypothetical protein